jgi:antitoxin component YwqK of YwqJK toxin-antitoxin module
MNRIHYDDTSMNADNSCVLFDGVPYTGEVVDTAEDGTVISVNTYRGGLQDGVQREFHWDGSPSARYTCLRGMPVGEALEWDPDGRQTRRRVFDQHGRLVEHDG